MISCSRSLFIFIAYVFIRVTLRRIEVTTLSVPGSLVIPNKVTDRVCCQVHDALAADKADQRVFSFDQNVVTFHRLCLDYGEMMFSMSHCLIPILYKQSYGFPSRASTPLPVVVVDADYRVIGIMQTSARITRGESLMRKKSVAGHT